MQYIDQTFDEERALYGVRGSELVRCTFDGPADGESALKEAKDIAAIDCDFGLRYPLWHVERGVITDCRMNESCRAALWYCEDIEITGSSLGGIKALRECADVTLEHSDVLSAEFGWLCNDVHIVDTTIASEYPFLFSRNLDIEDLRLQGKYSFQYVQEVTIKDSHLKTKDAFWHSRNVTVYDSILEGEYLGWYSQNLRLVRCTIKGAQPLCYASGLVLEDCEMVGCDLSFENSDVVATVTGSIDSVKNPRSGSIVADSIGETIMDRGTTEPASCSVSCRDQDSHMAEYREAV